MKRNIINFAFVFVCVLSYQQSHAQINLLHIYQLKKLVSDSMPYCYESSDTVFKTAKLDFNADGKLDYLLMTMDKKKGRGELYILISEKIKKKWIVHHLNDGITSWYYRDVDENNQVFLKANSFYLKYSEKHHGSFPAYSIFYIYFKFYKGRFLKIKSKEVYAKGKYNSDKLTKNVYREGKPHNAADFFKIIGEIDM